jgi:hypothetical protein
MGLGRTVEELEHVLSERALAKWVQYWKEEPWGTWRDNAHAAQIVAMLANVNRDSKKRPKPFEFMDFMLLPEDEAKARNLKRGLENLKAIAKKGKRAKRTKVDGSRKTSSTP